MVNLTKGHCISGHACLSNVLKCGDYVNFIHIDSDFVWFGVSGYD